MKRPPKNLGANAPLFTLLLTLVMTGCASTTPEVDRPDSVPASGPRTPSAPVNPPPVPDASVFEFSVRCNNTNEILGELLQPIVQNLVSQSIPYSQSPASEWRDCSGNFLRLSSYLGSRCANLTDDLAAPPGIADYDSQRVRNPGAGEAKARTTRQLAEWYEGRGQFRPVFYDDAESISDPPADLEAIRHLVRPGTVLWFAKRAPLRATGTAPLFDPESANRIVHMATVTRIRVAEGTNRITGFEMYHGRNQNHPGMVTRQHHWQWPRSFLRLDNDDPSDDKAYPPFGNWSQFLVGIATIVPVN